MFTIADVFAALGRIPPEGAENVEVNGVQIDSRLELTDRLFVAIRTESGDGNRFVGDAFARGAAAAIVQQPSREWPSTRQVVVDDSVAALGKLGSHLRRSSAAAVIGVTGSNGKTTTKEALASALSAAGATVKSARSFNNELGVPITLSEIDSATEFAVVEMGAQVVGEIAEYCLMAAPDAGIISNVGRAHVGLFGSAENVAKAKGELAESIGPGGVVVLNREDRWSRSIYERTSARVVWFGESAGEGVSARYSALEGLRGSRLELLSGARSGTIEVSAIGRHLANSFAAAVACGEALGVDFDTLMDGLRTFTPPPHRMEVRAVGGAAILDESYNANLNSMQYALSELANAAGDGRKIAVLGDMLELGEFTETDHREVGSSAAFLDRLITIGDKSRMIGEAAVLSGVDPRQVLHYQSDPADPASTCEAIAAVASRLQDELRDGDVVLVKGSNGLGLHRLADRLDEA